MKEFKLTLSSLKRVKSEQKGRRETRKEEASNTNSSPPLLHFLKTQRHGMGFTSGNVRHQRETSELAIFGSPRSQRGHAALWGGVSLTCPYRGMR